MLLGPEHGVAEHLFIHNHAGVIGEQFSYFIFVLCIPIGTFSYLWFLSSMVLGPELGLAEQLFVPNYAWMIDEHFFGGFL